MNDPLLFNEDTEFSILLPFIKDKKGDVIVDKIFASQISRNKNQAVDYFLGDFSRPMLDQFAVNLLGIPQDYEYGEPADVILGEFYELMASPFDGKEIGWDRVKKYKGENENGVKTRFSTYTYVVARNYFLKIAEKEKDRSHKEIEVEDIDKEDYEIILGCDIHDVDSFMETLNNHKKVSDAYFSLPEEDRIILQYLVVEKNHWSEAFNELRSFLNPNGPGNSWKYWSFEEKQRAIDEFWTPKQKQDAMKGLKNRALSHLALNYNELKKEE